MLVLLRVYDALEACVTQTHTVPGFLILYHQKVALNGGCAGEDSCQTADKPFQQHVRAVQSVPSKPLRGALVTASNLRTKHTIGRASCLVRKAVTY